MDTNIGGQLRQAREQRGLTLRDVSRVTKVPIAALDALERGDSERLARGIFTRGFVRAFAAQVGLDPERTVIDYLEQFRVEPPASPPEPKTIGAARRWNLVPAMVLLIV